MGVLSGWWKAGNDELSGLLLTLRDWPWFETLRTLRLRFREDRLGLTASSLTFTTLLALVPLVTVMLALFAAFPVFARFQDALQQYFLNSLVPDSIAGPVLRALTEFAGKANRLGTAGLVFLLISALALMLTIDRTLNGIWRVRKARPLAQRVLIYWAALTLGPLLLGISLTVTSLLVSGTSGLVERPPGGVEWLLNIAQVGLLAVAMSALFYHVPNTHVRPRHALAGGAFVAIAFEAAKSALAWYLQAMPGLSAVYGAFATLPILLLWIYLSWVIVLLGAVIAAYAPSLQMRVVRRPDTAGHLFAMALTMLGALARERQRPGNGLTVAQLSQGMRTDPLQIEPLIEVLVSLDWVARLDEDDAKRHVLLCDPQATPAAPLIDRLLLGQESATRAFRQRAGLEQMRLAELLQS
jgi:membrane protein